MEVRLQIEQKVFEAVNKRNYALKNYLGVEDESFLMNSQISDKLYWEVMENLANIDFLPKPIHDNLMIYVSIKDDSILKENTIKFLLSDCALSAFMTRLH